MNRGLRRFLILLVVFVAALACFSRQMNHETKDMTTDMAAAALPVVYFERGGKMVNELHGYVREMNAVSMRDTVTPLDEDGVLSLRVDTYGQKIEEASYEVRSLDTERLIQDAQLDVTASDQKPNMQITIPDLLEEGQEYLLILSLRIGDKPCCYYTRIVKNPEAHTQECLDFVEEFHDITMDKERQQDLVPYMEPSSEGDNSTLQKVTIHSSLAQTVWADFEGKEVTEPVASIKELNDSYHVILLDYIMSSVGEEGESEYYNVEEYYRVRYGEQKMYLLSFERTMEEIFRSEGNAIRGDAVDLGIRSADVDFKANETGKLICFVQQGELWSYDLEENKLSQVYSFRSLEGMDARENYDEHDIRIVRTDEGGSMDFIVYGYMNRGDHEGQVGVSVCHYDGVTGTVEEQLFIPSSASYQMLKEEIGKLMYISDSGIFYLAIGEQIHEIDLATRKDNVLVGGLSRDQYQVSDSGRYLAWTQEEGAQVMHLTDLETGASFDVTADEGDYIRPMGFIGTDCVYGTAKASDLEERTQNMPYAMRNVNIMDSAGSSHDILKTYGDKKTFVTGITIEEGSIFLDRVKKSGRGYVEIPRETILNRDMQEREPVYVSEKVSEKKQREITLQLPEAIPDTSRKFILSRQIIPDGSTEIRLENTGDSYAYCVYAKGKILLAGNDVAEAVRCADENGGVVTDASQSYVWQRVRKQQQTPLSAAGFPLRKNITYGEIAAEFPDSTVYDLTGCTLEQVLYFVGEGYPVCAVRESGRAELLAGCDDNYVWVYDGSSGRASSERIDDMSETYADSGNVFYCVRSD